MLMISRYFLAVMLLPFTQFAYSADISRPETAIKPAFVLSKGATPSDALSSKDPKISYPNKTDFSTDSPIELVHPNYSPIEKPTFSSFKLRTTSALQSLDGLNDNELNKHAPLAIAGVVKDTGSELISDYIKKLQERYITEDDEPVNFLGNVKKGLINTGHMAAEYIFANHKQFMSGDDKSMSNNLVSSGIQGLADPYMLAAKNSGIVGLTHLEVEYSFSNFNKPYVFALTTIPLFTSQDERHNWFTQASFSHGEQPMDDILNIGTARQTANLGIVYRYLNPEQDRLLGANFFIDHQWPYKHSRASIGVDYKTSQMGFYANRYLPLTGWQSSGQYYEERALGGADIGLSGKSQYLPQVELFAKKYIWFKEDHTNDIYGEDYRLEYTPVPALTFAAKYYNETEGNNGFEAILRFSYRFDISLKKQFSPAEAAKLKSVKDMVFDKVQRENRIRLEQRVKPIYIPTVTQSVGANTYTFAGETIMLDAGVTIPFGAVVNISNNVGDIVRVSYPSGALLVIGQNTTMTIGMTNIMLSSGIIQYISGSVNTTVSTPNGVITLLGTDIDVRVSGADETVRVRDGQVRVVTSGGLGVTNIGEISSFGGGIIPVVVTSGAAYLAHQTEGYNKLVTSLIGVIDEVKAAPYITGNPTLTATPTNTGEPLTISVPFSRAVMVSGSPTITVDYGGNNRTATFNASSSGTQNLTFSYNVIGVDGGASNVGIGAIAANGATFTDSSGKSALVYYNSPVTLAVAPFDNTPPVVTINTLTTGDSTPALTGTIDDNTATISITVNGSTYTATNNGNGTWTLANNTIAALANGTYSVVVTATDTSSNSATDNTNNELVINTVLPTVTVNSLTTNDTTPALTGTVSDNTATISVVVDGSTYAANNNGNGTWTLANNTITALAAGTYNVAVSATDSFSNVGTDATNNELVIDTTAPTVTVNTLSTGDTTPALTGTVNDNAATISVVVNGNTYAATHNGNGTWTLADNTIAALSAGTYAVTVTATDVAGNIGTDATTNELVIDTTAPSITAITIPNGNYILGNVMTATVTYDEAVTVNTSGGTPSLNVSVGGVTKSFTYASGSTTTSITFTYTVLSGDDDNNGVDLDSPIVLNSGTMRDASSNNAGLTFAPDPTNLPSVKVFPMVISGIQLWLDANDSATIFQDSACTTAAVAGVDTAGCWSDKSGNNRHARQAANVNNEPTYTSAAGGMNNRPVLNFDGSNDSFLTGLTHNPATGVSMFAVVKGVAFGGDRTVLSQQDGTGIGRSIIATSGATGDFIMCNWPGNRFLTTKGIINVNRVIYLEYVPTVKTFYVDGVFEGSESEATEAATGAWIIGAFKGQNGGWWSSGIAEIVVYNVGLSNADRDAAESYLGNKWGITVQ